MRRVLFVLGGPGSGKSTQCMRLSKTFNWTHLSVGDLLRSEKSMLIQEYLKDGQLVPTTITFPLIKKQLSTGTSLIDGFPRNLENLASWMKEMGNIPPLIYLKCSESQMKERLLKRARSDDTLDIIKQRLMVFREETLPVVDLYEEAHPNLLIMLNNKTSEEEILQAVQEV